MDIKVCEVCGHSADDHMVGDPNDYCIVCRCEGYKRSTSTLAIKNLDMIRDPYPGSLEWVRDQIEEQVTDWFINIQTTTYEVNALCKRYLLLFKPFRVLYDNSRWEQVHPIPCLVQSFCL